MSDSSPSPIPAIRIVCSCKGEGGKQAIHLGDFGVVANVLRANIGVGDPGGVAARRMHECVWVSDILHEGFDNGEPVRNRIYLANVRCPRCLRKFERRGESMIETVRRMSEAGIREVELSALISTFS
jgi:hypothetical protein